MNFAEKLKLIRNIQRMTQEDFSKTIGISRGNLGNLETGRVTPSKLLINCIASMFDIDKEWLLSSDESLSALTKDKKEEMAVMIKYRKLNREYRLFVEKQIDELLKIQLTDNSGCEETDRKKE